MIHGLHHSEDLYSFLSPALISLNHAALPGPRLTFFPDQSALPSVVATAKMEFMIC